MPQSGFRPLVTNTRKWAACWSKPRRCWNCKAKPVSNLRIGKIPIRTKKMKSVGAFVILILSGFSALATTWQSDGSQVSVQNLHDNSASDGDTIVLPAGTFSWTSPVKITKGVTLQGQTTVTGTPGNQTANDLTVIRDDTPRSGNNAMIVDVSIAASQSFRMTGITFATGISPTYSDGEAAVH